MEGRIGWGKERSAIWQSRLLNKIHGKRRRDDRKSEAASERASEEGIMTPEISRCRCQKISLVFAWLLELLHCSTPTHGGRSACRARTLKTQELMA